MKKTKKRRSPSQCTISYVQRGDEVCWQAGLNCLCTTRLWLEAQCILLQESVSKISWLEAGIHILCCLKWYPTLKDLALLRWLNCQVRSGKRPLFIILSYLQGNMVPLESRWKHAPKKMILSTLWASCYIFKALSRVSKQASKCRISAGYLITCHRLLWSTFWYAA